MVTSLVVVIGSYLLGSIPFGYLIGRIGGIDIRQGGRCNIGATNVVRVLGKRYGYPVFILDFLKGFGAVKLSMLLATRPPDFNSLEVFGIIAAACSVVGHSYPLWLRFKGGKGVATSAGALFALTALCGLIMGKTCSSGAIIQIGSHAWEKPAKTAIIYLELKFLTQSALRQS